MNRLAVGLLMKIKHFAFGLVATGLKRGNVAIENCSTRWCLALQL